MDLADARFADAKHLADLAQIQFFVVIQRKHKLFAVWQTIYGTGKMLFESISLQTITWTR